MTPRAADAHGSIVSPASRSYACNFLEPENVTCDQIWAENPDVLLDWMDIAIPDADGRHEEIIPDGELCSAGLDKYEMLDLATSEWPTTTLVENAEGLYEFVYEETAPHDAEYFRFYVTKQGYSSTQPLRWEDLELVHDTGPLAADANIFVETALPERYGQHILYTIWQRSENPEAYYACSDIDFGNLHSDVILVPAVAAPEWSPSIGYPAGDLVTHEGETYRAIRWSLGSAPNQVGQRAWRRVDDS